ncbi:helix-turn-helix transcriptional regulator [Aquincola tertiaricarbonis]|uniref:helix-turn-helix transcriptional regulator n=1 Tax=Aquincola tertiaricarbonis TaxID=391953 RepID=UPI000614D5BD|nr:AraC family transcriptional regulator [Aquincola tertiaricarbonis]
MPRAVGAALAYIHAHLDERLPLQELAAQAGLSVWRLATVFRRHTGASPRRYICAARVRQVQALLDGGVPVAAAAMQAGFYDQSHLSRHFKQVCGMTPGQYLARRRQAAD